MSGPVRWVVLFFTRPIHFSDVGNFVRKLKQRRRDAAAAAAVAATTVALARPKRRAEAPDSLPAKARARAASGAIRAAPATLRDKLDVGVSEEPADTLPADLRDELFGAGKSGQDAAPGRTAE